MANDSGDFDKNIENIKSTVRSSFVRLYAALKARELKTLRQIDALRKQCENNKELAKQCVQNIHINYDSESTLLDLVSNFAAIDFEKLNFDNNTFTLEDYISPFDDHMYSYKTIDDLTQEDDNKELEAIEEAALKEVTKTDNCVCSVNIRTEDISKKFRNVDTSSSTVKPASDTTVSHFTSPKTDENKNSDVVTEKHSIDCTDEDIKKINPTDDWLESIKSQTETEPMQGTEGMEHSNISCTCKVK